MNGVPAVQESQVPDIFQERDPQAVIKRYSAVASAVAEVIKQQHLYVEIGPRRHVFIEGWQTLGAPLGIFARVEWTKRLKDGDRWGYEARAVAHRVAGDIISSAEAECWSDEENWRDRADFQLRSMAQTRACAKALRLALGFVMVLAGFEATPAEEMDGVGQKRSQPRAQAARDGSPARDAGKATQPQMGKIRGLYTEIGAEKADNVIKQLVPHLCTIDEDGTLKSWRASMLTKQDASSVIEMLMHLRERQSEDDPHADTAEEPPIAEEGGE